MATDRVQKEFNLLNEKVQKLHHDLEDQIHTNTQLLAENSQKVLELKQREEDIAAVKVQLPTLELLKANDLQPAYASFTQLPG